MVNSAILSDKVQLFIEEHQDADTAKLALKGSPFPDVSVRELMQQIQGKQKSKKKLPLWYNSSKIIYPPLLNLSQTSSEKTARYKSGLISGKNLVDITGGFGIDFFFLSEKFEKSSHCEINPELSDITRHNYKMMAKKPNAVFYNEDGIAFLKKADQETDWIYADPGRRSETSGRVFRLEDCQPNILEHLDLLRSKSKHILLKTSPLLDITQGIHQLQSVESIHIVAVKNEVKELLWIVGQDKNTNPPISCINLKSQNTERFKTSLLEENQQMISYADEFGNYLYEPNAAILKAGFFKSVAAVFNLHKIAVNSHLYTSDYRLDFPGRRFLIKEVLPARKKELKAAGISRGNVTARNFPLSPEEIKKKFKISDGGSSYLFFTQNNSGKKLVVHTEKL